MVRAEDDRLKVLNLLQSYGVPAYPNKYALKHTIREVRSMPLSSYVKTAGRVRAVRKHGKAIFIDLWDEEARIQAYFKLDIIGERLFSIADSVIDVGDIVGVEGELFTTRMGELTILVKNYNILAKALKTPPKEWYGVRDPELKYRKRYLTLLVNPGDRRVFVTRSKVISEMRKFLESRGFIEVDTPILQPIYGGASAKPFKTYVNALNEEWYLRISPEIYLKKLIVAGFNKIFEVAKVFRNEDIDAQHNPEFTLMELYMAYADYEDIMNLTEELVEHLALNVAGREYVNVCGQTISLKKPFNKMTMFDALRRYAGLAVDELSDREITEILEENNIVLRSGYSRGIALAEIFEKLCRGKLIQPTFILDYPSETTPLCKPHRSQTGLIERFELYIAGLEVANAYTELNDPLLQEKLLVEQVKRRALGDEEAHMYDEDFIEALMYGMPPTGGLGIGVDRLVMILTESISMKDVIPFPMMRPKTVEADSI